jgi:prevent-host-death family protein
MTTLSLSEVKARLSELVDRVQSEHERVLLTRNGKPAALLISPDDLAAIEETIGLLSDPEAMSDIRQAKTDISAGEVVTADELRAKYLGE